MGAACATESTCRWVDLSCLFYRQGVFGEALELRPKETPRKPSLLLRRTHEICGRRASKKPSIVRSPKDVFC
jgi:hypothetical protein